MCCNNTESKDTTGQYTTMVQGKCFFVKWGSWIRMAVRIGFYSLDCDYWANMHCKLSAENDGHHCEPLFRLQEVIRGESLESH